MEALAFKTTVITCREAGGIEELVSIASQGVALITDNKDGFLAAMKATHLRGDVSNLRPLLLRDEFLRTSIVLLE